MRKNLIIVLALVCLAGLSASAFANEGDLVVNIPHDFVASGKTLPAGKYRVGRVSNDPLELSFRSYDNHIGAFVLPTTLSGEPAERLGLTFETNGNAYVLTGITSPDGVYTIAQRAPSSRATGNSRQTAGLSGGAK
jgi:hypothetical protein